MIAVELRFSPQLENWNKGVPGYEGDERDRSSATISSIPTLQYFVSEGIVGNLDKTYLISEAFNNFEKINSS
jgi:hypothetical protein